MNQEAGKGIVAASNTGAYEIAVYVIEHRRSLLLSLGTAALLSAGLAYLRPRVYSSTAVVLPKQKNAPELGALSALAGQVGIGGSIGTGTSLASSGVIQDMIRSRTVLTPLARDSTIMIGLTRRESTRFFSRSDDSDSAVVQRRLVASVRVLQRAITLRTSKNSAALTLEVVTRSPTVSQRLASAIVAGVDSLLIDVGRQQASRERSSLSRRLAEEERRIEELETQKGQFIRSNRDFRRSPELVAEYDRLERRLSLQLQVLNGVAQTNENLKSREVEDTPNLVFLERPARPVLPEPRGVPLYVSLGVALAFSVHAIATAAGRTLRLRANEGDRTAVQVLSALAKVTRAGKH